LLALSHGRPGGGSARPCRRLRGEPGDIAPRVALLYSIYEDSGGNHTFPLVALHGALWAKHYFDAAGPIAKQVSLRYFYNTAERARRRPLMRGT
jgi:hypothetical protein